MKFVKPKVTLVVKEGVQTKLLWSMFAPHHYMSSALNNSSRCYVAYWDDNPVALYAVLAMPSGTLKKAYRGHRLVVLPDFQGMGIGKSLCELVGELYIAEGKRLFTKTSNKKLGEYRNSKTHWRETSHSGKRRNDSMESAKHVDTLVYKPCYCHEYMGKSIGVEDRRPPPMEALFSD